MPASSRIAAAQSHPAVQPVRFRCGTPPCADGRQRPVGQECLHMVSVLLLDELHEATGEPSAAVLQRLAILAEHRRGTPSAG
jgi:hypothetical protein